MRRKVTRPLPSPSSAPRVTSCPTRSQSSTIARTSSKGSQASASPSEAPLAKDRNSSSKRCISVTSRSRGSRSSSSNKESPSFIRVRGVRKSWLTPDSISVRCSIWRSILLRISKKACPAARTSIAPEGRKSFTCPRPNAAAALASRLIGRS